MGTSRVPIFSIWQSASYAYKSLKQRLIRGHLHNHILLLLFVFLLPCICQAQARQRVSLPNREQLSAERVLHVMQDSEKFLWYATEGGGLCRDWQRSTTSGWSPAHRHHWQGRVCIFE